MSKSGNKFLELANSKIEELSNELDIVLPSSTFCILPFSHLSTTTTGEIRLCCRSKPIGHIKNQSLKQVWSSEKMDNIRQDFIDNKKISECDTCWKSEAKNIVSLRQGQNIARISEFGDGVRKFLKHEEIPLPTLELKLSNRCNLMCKMCSPAASTKWVNSWTKLSSFFDEDYSNWVDKVISTNQLYKNPNLDLFLSNPSFSDDFETLAPSLKLIDFAGGEPLIDPIHYSILKKVIEKGQSKNTTLRYSTNLTVLSFQKFDVLELWNQFKEVHLTISVDGHSKLNEYIRQGTKSSVFEKNIEIIKNLPKVTSIKCSTTLSAYNALFIAETIDYIINTLKCGWHTSRVTSPSFLDARIWSQKEIESAINNVSSLPIHQYDINEYQKIQLERHINDYISWMTTKLDDRELLLEKFWHYTIESDQHNNQSYSTIMESL
jgi:MoaA/NifB/PqqE/SkfB family radical SAM enzyme